MGALGRDYKAPRQGSTANWPATSEQLLPARGREGANSIISVFFVISRDWSHEGLVPRLRNAPYLALPDEISVSLEITAPPSANERRPASNRPVFWKPGAPFSEPPWIRPHPGRRPMPP